MKTKSRRESTTDTLPQNRLKTRRRRQAPRKPIGFRGAFCHGFSVWRIASCPVVPRRSLSPLLFSFVRLFAALLLLCLPPSFFSVRHSPPRSLSPVRPSELSARGIAAPPKHTRSPCSARFARPLSSRCSRPLQPSIALLLCSPAAPRNQSAFSEKDAAVSASSSKSSHPHAPYPIFPFTPLHAPAPVSASPSKSAQHPSPPSSISLPSAPLHALKTPQSAYSLPKHYPPPSQHIPRKMTHRPLSSLSHSAHPDFRRKSASARKHNASRQRISTKKDAQGVSCTSVKPKNDHRAFAGSADFKSGVCSLAVASMSLMRFSWLTRVADGS